MGFVVAILLMLFGATGLSIGINALQRDDPSLTDLLMASTAMLGGVLFFLMGASLVMTGLGVIR